MRPALVILGLVTLQRAGELLLAAHNTRRLLATGAREYGARHYPLIVLLHIAWLAGLWILAWNRPANLAWLAAYLAVQGGRIWVMASLGRRWTTRIIVPPDAALVRKGPYSLLRHPNYVVVAAEIAILPLVFGLATFAAAFSALNAAVLWPRTRAEERALRGD